MTLARRRLRPRQPVLGMVLVLTAALTALGQEAPTREAPPSTSTTTPQDLSAAALWSQVSERLAALRTLGERVAVLSLQHEAASQERARLTGERATLDTAIELPDPAVVPTQDSARALQERTEVRARSVDSARRIDAELAVALGREQSLVEELSGTERRQLATLRELDLLAKELERRTPALLGESWTGFSLPRESRPEVVGARIAEVESTLAKRAGMIEQGAALLRSLRERRAALERSSANLLHTRRVLANRLAEAVNRSEYGRVYGAQDAAALLSAQSARAGVWRQDLDKLEAATAERESAAAAAQGIRTEREALPTPSSEGLVVDEPTESLRSAKRALLEAEARRDYRRLRVELTGRLIGEVERLLLLTEEQTATVSAALHLTGELEVVGGILTERATKGEIDASALPEEPSKEALSHRGVGLRTQLANLESERLRLPVELEGLRASLKGDREVVEALDSEIPKLELAVQREESLARWIREVQELPTPKVLEQYRATADRLAAATVAIGRLNGITERADKEARGAEERANQLVDPLLRQAGPALESFRELAGEELTRWTSDPRYAELGVKPTPLLTVAGQLMPQGGSEAAVPVRPAASPSGSNGSESAVDLTEAQIEAVQARRAAVLGQVRHLEEREAAFANLLEAVRIREQRLTELEAAHVAAIDLTRRLWGCAVVLVERSVRGELPSSELPSGTREAASRDRVVEAQDRAKRVREDLQRAAGQRQRLEVPDPSAPLAKPLKDRVQVLGRKLALLRERRDLRAKVDQHRVLDELQTKTLEHEVRARLSDESLWYERALGVFGSDESAELTEILHGHYKNLIELERRADNLRTQRGQTTRLEGHVAESRALLTVLEPIVRERLLSFEVDQATQVARARVALRPGRIDLLADLKQRFGVVVDPPAPIVAEERTAERLRKLAESLFDATARVAACTRWLERIEWAQARLGDLDVELGVYQDQIAKLTAELEEVQESIARLKGSAAGSPKAEQATTRQGEEDRSTLEQGEIAWLRQRRLKALILASLGTLGWLLLVPFIALLMIRGGKSVGKRILKRIESEPEQAERTLSEQRERMERARTLVTTFRTVWNAVVIVLAIAYLLKAIRVDVTPLVASAGIVGLAFAFGSQALVRDYVSGFFILLESQYNLGDVVTINGTGGRVEKITLRMTVLRDIEGAVHFIPNGTVTSVTNRMKAWSQAKLEIGVAYKEDPDRVMACLQGVGEELMLDEVFKPLVTAIEVPGLEQFGDSSIIFRVHLKVAPGEQWRVAREYRRRVKYAFDREGIEIPFPQRVIHQSWVRETREAAAERSVVDPRSGDAPTPNDLTVER